MSSRVILLGHTGFLGRKVFEALRATGADVLGFSSADIDLRRPEALNLLDTVIDPEAAVVLASALTPDKGMTLDVLQANLDIVMNTARYLENHPVAKCVYISSDAVYASRHTLVNEDTPAEATNLYALAKCAGEQMLQRAASATGMKLLALRVTGVYGPGDTHGSYGPNRFLRSIVTNGAVTLFGQGEEQRDHLYVGDAAALIARLLGDENTQGVFNLATGQSCSFAAVVDLLRQIVPRDFTVESRPRQGSIVHRHYDVTRLFLALPDFRFTPLADGLAATCKSITDQQG